MKQTSFMVVLLVVLGGSRASSQTSIHPPSPQYGTYDTDGIQSNEYRQRRAAVRALMDSGSIAVFRANDPDNRNGDVDYKFRQADNFFYLTGCNETNSTLILAREDVHIDSSTVANEILFVGAHTKSWSGYTLGVDGARHVLGFGAEGKQSIVLAAERLKALMPQILLSKKTLYYTPSLPDILFDPIANIKFVAVREVKKELGEKFPNLSLKGSGLLVQNLRTVKSPGELLLLQKAMNATISGCIDAIKACEPMMYEYELQALIEYAYTRNGCEFSGFPSIIGSGPNSLNFHYDANRRQMMSGELVVMDLGAEYHGYSADVTRTIPVNGTYTPSQKEIYSLVLRAQKSAIDEIRPGAPVNASWKKGMEVLGKGLVALGILQDEGDVHKYCPHGISHFVGLDVHDVGSITTLAPGMILTMEPGIYIPDSSACDKKYWGIGIRIEDDILVTQNGRKVLSHAAPRTTDDIEMLMKNKKKGKEQ